METMLETIKRKHGYTDEEMAEILGIQTKYYRILEAGKRRLSKRLIKRATEKFNLSEFEIEELSRYFVFIRTSGITFAVSNDFVDLENNKNRKV